MPDAIDQIHRWLCSNKIAVLNVAGPRQSEDDRVYSKVKLLLTHLLLASSPAPAPSHREIVSKAYDQRLANFRHWDQIRWLVPYWFVTLATAGAAIVSLVNKQSEPFVRLASAGFGLFAALCLYLLIRLIIYHNKSRATLEHAINLLVQDPDEKAILSEDLPFTFDWKGLPKTATFWFMLYILAIMVASFFIALRGLWWI